MEEKIIKYALEEDFRYRGDITSQAIFTAEKGEYKLVANDKGILCGSEYFCKVFAIVDEETRVKFLCHDGDEVFPKNRVADINGKIQSILKAERVALNFLSHLSGIATKTHSFVKRLRGETKILDTRKTLPGLREAQKYAVECGGGKNHRMGLYDLVMIKDNHIDGAGSIKKAVQKVKEKWGNKFKIEVETRNLEEVKEALKSGADIIMVDNMKLDEMKKAVKIIGEKALSEASGNMTVDRIAAVSQIGVNYISVGALTHTVKAFDFSLVHAKEHYEFR
ncbi:MAG: carboxylating nicotinate-nucleotide diphosphorylase [Candidatus Cloacimonadota bacterium]|nr:carboxylating nicotinate-nucleotide diphosphorylase [Candidatus Cloacimonadota bacterium]